MQILLIAGGAMIALLVFATLYKYYEVRKAAHWRPTPGRIVSSQTRARKVRTGQTHHRAVADGDLQIRNFAEIRYEYQVGNKTYRGTRIGIGEDIGDDDVEGKLSRYRTGARVTVYYDPSDPQQAVLETGAPEGVWRTMAIFIGVLVLLMVGGIYGFEAAVASLRDKLTHPERAVPILALAGLALFVALIARVSARQARAAQGWPTTEGVIESSEIERFEAHRSGTQERHLSRRMFRPDIVYSYRVGGAELKGSRLRFGGRFYANFDSLAHGEVETYPVGRKVTVYYNPDNASEAVLEPVAGGLWVAWLATAALAAGALYLALN